MTTIPDDDDDDHTETTTVRTPVPYSSSFAGVVSDVNRAFLIVSERRGASCELLSFVQPPPDSAVTLFAFARFVVHRPKDAGTS